MGCVYIIENLENGKVYVGSTTKQPGRRRWNEHHSLLRHGRHKNAHLQHAWNKYGEDAFEFAVMENHIPDDELIEAEQHWLDQMRVEGEVYNTGPAAVNPMLGRVHTPETRRKISESHRGKTLSARHRRRIGESVSGRKNGFYGRSHTKEAKRKNSEAHARPYPTFIHQDTGEIIPAGMNLTALCRGRGLNRGNMGEVMWGNRKSHKGWVVWTA